MHRLMSRALLVLCGSALSAACSGDSTPAPALPTGPPPSVTETITGDLNRNGAFTQPFLAGASGDIRATLDSLDPEGVTAIGVSLGTWNGSACQVIIANDNAVPGAIVIGQTSVASNLCLRVYDVGKIPERASYQITLVHP
jgi:hypothetical protein